MSEGATGYITYIEILSNTFAHHFADTLDAFVPKDSLEIDAN